MRKHLTYASALLGVVLLVAPAAQAGDRDGRSARGARSGSAFGRSRSSVSRPSPSRSAFSSRSRGNASPFRAHTQSRSSQSLGNTQRNRSGRSLFSSRSRTPSVSSSTRSRAPRVTAPSRSQASPRTSRSSGLLFSGSRSRARSGSPSPALDRLRTRGTSPRPSTAAPAVANRGIRASSPGDTGRRARGSVGSSLSQRFGSRRSDTSGLAAPVTRSRVGSGSVGTRHGTSSLTRSRTGSRSSLFGSRTRSHLGTRSPLGTRSSGLIAGGTRTRSAVGGSVRTRPGTRGRIGRSYRIRSHHHHHGHHHHGPTFGFYYTWNPYYVPYYRVYPRYGLYFGYGLTWYGPSYSTVFVDAVDYYPSTHVIVEEQIVEEQLIEEAPAPAPAAAPPAQFPEPAPPEAPAEQAQAHPDFEPAVQDFLGGRYQSALQRLDRVLAAQPDNGEAWLAAMHANFALGQYGRAGHALAQAAALDAFPRGYRFDPRPLYAQTGNFDRAVQALEDHMRRNPQDADALLLRAYLHVSLGERTPAQDLIQKVLQIRPADETAPALALALLPPPPPPSPSPETR